MNIMYEEPFREILRRVRSAKNDERYQSLFFERKNDDERRLYALCEKFWSPENRILDIDHYIVNDTLNPQVAMKYIDEIKMILDKLGWDQ